MREIRERPESPTIPGAEEIGAYPRALNHFLSHPAGFPHSLARGLRIGHEIELYTFAPILPPIGSLRQGLNSLELRDRPSLSGFRIHIGIHDFFDLLLQTRIPILPGRLL